MLATFDQCCFGLCSKVWQTPMRKTTTFMTNAPTVYRHFANIRCTKGDHPHVAICGQEGGESRASFSAKYPQEMCGSLMKCLLTDMP